jgi:hypothetical protein
MGGTGEHFGNTFVRLLNSKRWFRPALDPKVPQAAPVA